MPAAGNANHQVAQNGCSSTTLQAGTLTSPPFDTPQATSGLLLSFDTWWEIESQNPLGFDLMHVEISIDGGSNWQLLAALNEASTTATPNQPLSNLGQQVTPNWEQAPAIDLAPSFAGLTDVLLRFNFNSVDNAHNGFRGWGVDNVQISDGISPALSESFDGSAIPAGWASTGLWRIPLSPEDTLIHDGINPPLITLGSSDAGLGVANLPSSTGYAWFGDGTGTYCGEDFLVNLSLSPPSDARTTGTTQVVTAQTEDALPESVIRWDRSGANPGQGSAPPGGLGSAQISWVGTNAGSDSLSVHFDRNGNGQQEVGEPVQFGFYSWTAPSANPPTNPPPPVTQPQPQQQQPLQEPPARPRVMDDLDDPAPFREVNIEPVEGQVFVRLPGGSSRASQAGAPRGFIPLTQAEQIPIRSIVDTSRGKVRMESAFSASGRTTQTAEFFDGQFQVLQSRSRKPITEMVLKGGSFRGCPRARQSASWSRAGQDAQRRRRVRRRLWGSGRGRFRTRGRYSSATVRGTTWLVEDRCDGTLTRLPRRPRTSRVDVRDLVTRRTIRLRAGRSYLARPRAARRR